MSANTFHDMAARLGATRVRGVRAGRRWTGFAIVVMGMAVTCGHLLEVIPM